jgi:hypothetical protein
MKAISLLLVATMDVIKLNPPVIVLVVPVCMSIFKILADSGTNIIKPGVLGVLCGIITGLHLVAEKGYCDEIYMFWEIPVFISSDTRP